MNFCTRNCPPEMTLELNLVNRHVLQFVLICLNAKIFMRAKDMGCFATFIQTAVNCLSNLKYLMVKHVMFDNQLVHVFMSRVHA